MPPPPDPKWCASLAGTLVEDFRLEQFIGAGRIGYVYRSSHKDLPGSVRAVKLTFDTVKPGWEVELTKVLQLELVDGVVHFHHLGTQSITSGGQTRLCQYTIWDFISPGENLGAHLRRVGRIPTSFLLAVVERILYVLHACDAQGVARHGDLHSGNILIGDRSLAKLDDSLQPRAPIYVSDFGYGATGGVQVPKDDYTGLATIINEMIPRVDYATATPTHRQLLKAMQRDLGKLLRESGTERRKPIDLLRLLMDLKRSAQAGVPAIEVAPSAGAALGGAMVGGPSVGQFQVSEMIGDRWDWWRRLFVPTVPARSKILALDIPTVLTGPRGCGKTMLLRRLSERLIVECGEVTDALVSGRFVAFYVNSNDFADAFAHFPEQPSLPDEARLTCYANLCVLAEVLAVQSARAGRLIEPATEAFLELVRAWLVPAEFSLLVVGEDRLERYRALLEQIKWTFPHSDAPTFPGYGEMSQHRWLPRFVQQLRACCPWIGQRSVLIFIDDFSTPRVSLSMQRVLNRLFLQRSPEFLAKVATEAWSTFIPEDSSGKTLQDLDDYQLVDMGEESLFLPEGERLEFLNQVFSRRLSVDPRVPSGQATLPALLGRMGLSKTEFARRLRTSLQAQLAGEQPSVDAESQRRGRSRGRVHYFGADVFSALWSGDTRTMIQLIADVIDHASVGGEIRLPVRSTIQDRVFRNRGGEWLNSHTRNEPTDPVSMQAGLAQIRAAQPNYSLRGGYGDHLKAVVEAFVDAATKLLLGPTYIITEKGGTREVPRMAFRIEIVDEFRVDGLAHEIYRDLIRYGLFMRDSRGKSVRGTFVPRLYLRRLLLPFGTLALSKRDSVPLSNAMFTQLLLEPDAFKLGFASRYSRTASDQMLMPFVEAAPASTLDAAYDDLDDDSGTVPSDSSADLGDEDTDE
jgi:hypothetical protein